jgi:AraC family transcriptional regulator
MGSIRNLQNTVDYIEAHMDHQFDLDVLAKEACLSPFYFHRLFSKATGMTLYSYVKKRRLTTAARRIKDCSKSINEIASGVGYVNYEQFSRDFKQEFSITPASFRASKMPVIYTPKLDFNLIETIVGEDETVIFDEMSINIKVQACPEIHTAGISKLCGISKGVDDPGMLQGIFHGNNIGSVIPDQPDPPVSFGIGVTNYLSNGTVNGFTYIVARQVVSYDHMPEELTLFPIPQGLYAVCRVEAETFDMLVNEVMYKAGNYMLNKWLPGNGRYQFKGEMTIERYYDEKEDGSAYFDYCFPVTEI